MAFWEPKWRFRAQGQCEPPEALAGWLAHTDLALQKVLKFLSKFKEIAPSRRPHYRQTIVFLAYFEAF